MKRTALLALVLVLGLGCGGGSASSGASTTAAGDGAPVGNAAVQARIASVPAPPIPWSTPFASLTAESAAALCPWVDAHVSPTAMEEHCPDGSTVRAAGPPCTADSTAGMAGQLGEAGCTMTIAEFFACNLGIRAEPCTSGMLGSDLAECEAMTECIRASFRHAAEQQRAAGSTDDAGSSDEGSPAQ